MSVQFHIESGWHRQIRSFLVKFGERVAADQWQSTADVDPMKQVIEAQFATLVYPMPQLVASACIELQPNLPWAEDHFQERVGGLPLNPPPSHAWWPFNKQNEKFMPDAKFSHSYPERLWGGSRWITPQYSGVPDGAPMQAIANLNDLLTLLRDHPTTRQAFIPIWWPIDGKMAEKERVPCTIGYHFMLREGMLHCHYFMRSCDAMRHLPDDLYMATRLTQWICDRLNTDSEGFYREELQPGMLHMAVSSLHIFQGDVQVIKFLESQNA